MDSKWKRIRTLEQLRDKMSNDSYFEPRHFRKIEAAIEHLKDIGIKCEPK